MYSKPCLQCNLSTVLGYTWQVPILNLRTDKYICGIKTVVSCKGTIRSPVLINIKPGSCISTNIKPDETSTENCCSYKYNH